MAKWDTQAMVVDGKTKAFITPTPRSVSAPNIIHLDQHMTAIVMEKSKSL